MREMGAELGVFWPGAARVLVIALNHTALLLALLAARLLLLGRDLPDASEYLVLAAFFSFIWLLIAAILAGQSLRVYESGIAYRDAAWRERRISWSSIREAGSFSAFGFRYVWVRTASSKRFWVPAVTNRLRTLATMVETVAGQGHPLARSLGSLAA
jgi:hypothetical protein